MIETNCECCGQRVRKEGGTTHYYVGAEAEENARLREALEKVATINQSQKSSLFDKTLAHAIEIARSGLDGEK